MRPSFHPRPVNGPFGDPGVFVSFLFERRAILFDSGDIHSLPPKDILKISHVFVSHTHMDHFTGFDRLLRLFLGREKEVFMYGPKGFLKNVEGKLAGYSWNLVEHYTNRFRLCASEISGETVVTRSYPCRTGFVAENAGSVRPFTGMIHTEPGLSVSAAILDHSIPCLGFALKERFHVNIVKDRLDDMGLAVGPWLKDFKTALFEGRDPNSDFMVTQSPETGPEKYVLGDLAREIAIITPGQKIVYITDVVCNESNERKIINLAKDADHLFIEAAFLDRDKDQAGQKYHLTARQAGTLAAKAGAKQFTISHFSPRYLGMEESLQMEAETAYGDESGAAGED